jgi:regulator of protease activity HflC (stomatin/prohibitin superfamily)
MIKRLITLFLLVTIGLANTGCVLRHTGPNEVGVRTRKLGILNSRGVEQKTYLPGQTYFIVPIVNDWHTFDTKLQNIEMTATIDKGDQRGKDDLKFKTIDGNDIALDVIISYRILKDKAPYILEFIASNDHELRMKIVRSITRSRPRDIFGELKTEDFYTSSKRAEKAEKAKSILNNMLNPYGVIVENVLTKDYRFNPAYQKAIEDKKIADQKAEQNKSATKAMTEEYLRRMEEANGEVNKMVANVDGEYKRSKIEVDAYYEQQANIAGAIKAEAKAEAKGITAMNKALASKGGTVMVKLKIAEALKGKKIFLLPSSSGNDLSLKTLDLNKFLEIKGVQNLSESAAAKTTESEEKKPKQKKQTKYNSSRYRYNPGK